MKDKKKRKTSSLSRKLFILFCIGYPLIQFAFFTISVNFQTLIYAFQRFNLFQGKWQFVGFDNFISLFKNIGLDRSMRMGLINTPLFILWTVLVILPVSIFISYILFRGLPLAKFYRLVYFVPSILSVVITTMIFSFMINPRFGFIPELMRMLGLGNFVKPWLGNSNTALLTILIYCLWAGIGYNIILLNGAISRISTEIFEYGKTIGLGPMRELFQVVVPMIWPTISTLIIYGTAGNFGIVLQSKLLTNGGPNGSTYTMALTIMQYVVDRNFGMAAAYGIVIAIIGYIVTITIKHFIDKVPTVEY